MSAASDIARDLASNIEAVAASILGPHNRTLSTRRQHRWGAKGSIAVEVAGPKQGSWFDHETGTGGDPLDLICHVCRSDIREALSWARAWLGTAEPLSPDNCVLSKIDREPDGERTGRELAAQIWREATPAAGTVVERYLASRGLRLPAATSLRFHQLCPRGRDRLPAMVALMTDAQSGEPRAIHRTFVRSDGNGKADITPAKMMLGPSSGAVVRLQDDADVEIGLGVTEGIETSLSVQQHFWRGPVWACCSAGGIARLPVIPGIQALSIFADADDAGLRAAHACAENWLRGDCSEVRIVRPKAAGDWNDAIMGALS